MVWKDIIRDALSIYLITFIVGFLIGIMRVEPFFSEPYALYVISSLLIFAGFFLSAHGMDDNKCKHLALVVLCLWLISANIEYGAMAQIFELFWLYVLAFLAWRTSALLENKRPFLKKKMMGRWNIFRDSMSIFTLTVIEGRVTATLNFSYGFYLELLLVFLGLCLSAHWMRKNKEENRLRYLALVGLLLWFLSAINIAMGSSVLDWFVTGTIIYVFVCFSWKVSLFIESRGFAGKK